MNINTSNLNASFNYSNLNIKQEKVEEIINNLPTKIESSSIKFTYIQVDFQSSIEQNDFQKNYDEFQNFLSDIGYSGKPIGTLTQDEASQLVSEDGFFGVTQTSERIANFVLMGAGDDKDMLLAGREGILQGFKEAESMWGGKLPDISYTTIDKAVEMIDKKLQDLGFSVLDEKV